jgi:hypothetical protein
LRNAKRYNSALDKNAGHFLRFFAKEKQIIEANHK